MINKMWEMERPFIREKMGSLRENARCSYVLMKLRCEEAWLTILFLPSTPPWLFKPPKMILTLTQFPKNSTSAPIYHSYLQEIISSFSSPTLCFTDGSKSKNIVGLAFSEGDTTVALCHRNPTSSYTAESQAIFSCLEHILTTTHSPSSLSLIHISEPTRPY